MHTHYSYTVEELEDMVPFELEIYLNMTREYQRKMAEAQAGG